MIPSASSTQPTNAVFDGCRYNFLPWENAKPCIAVESCWEDISFRIDTVNMLLGMVDMMVSHKCNLLLALKMYFIKSVSVLLSSVKFC